MLRVCFLVQGSSNQGREQEEPVTVYSADVTKHILNTAAELPFTAKIQI